MILLLFLILLVLGSIFFGIVIFIEVGVVGCLGAIVFVMVKGKLSWIFLRKVCDVIFCIIIMVMFIFLGFIVFSLVFWGVEGDCFMFDLFFNFFGGMVGFLVVSMIIVFLLGFFIDFFEIVFIVVFLFVFVVW